MMPHEIELDIDAGGKGSVKLDGKELQCKGISIQSEAHKSSIVTIKLIAVVKGKVQVKFLTNIVEGDLDGTESLEPLPFPEESKEAENA